MSKEVRAWVLSESHVYPGDGSTRRIVIQMDNWSMRFRKDIWREGDWHRVRNNVEEWNIREEEVMPLFEAVTYVRLNQFRVRDGMKELSNDQMHAILMTGNEP